MQHRLSCEELQPQHAGEAKNNQKRIPLAPRQPKICKVDLTLVAGWRLETLPRIDVERRPLEAYAQVAGGVR